MKSAGLRGARLANHISHLSLNSQGTRVHLSLFRIFIFLYFNGGLSPRAERTISYLSCALAAPRNKRKKRNKSASPAPSAVAMPTGDWLSKPCPRKGGYAFEQAGLCCGRQRGGWGAWLTKSALVRVRQIVLSQQILTIVIPVWCTHHAMNMLPRWHIGVFHELC
jgi:hypothetical protein